MTETGQDRLQTTTREVQTVVADSQEMSIRKLDWTRVYRKVRSVPREPRLYRVLWTATLGVSATAFLSLFPMYSATDTTASWVKPTYWAVALCALFVGVLSFVFDKQSSKIIRASCQEVLQDMRDVHATYFPEDDLDVL